MSTRSFRYELRQAADLVHTPFRSWIAGAVLGPVAVALLDTLGVAAMIPLMQVVTGASTDKGVLWAISRISGAKTTQEILLVLAAVVGGAFVLKSLATLSFRWWLLGKTTTMEAEAAAELMRRYGFAAYWAHRERKVAETIILVAHRLSTVRHSDKVVFMTEGGIQAEGPFEEVERKNTEFARLVELGKLA